MRKNARLEQEPWALSKVHLRGGVVGKVTLAVIAGSVTLGSIGVAGSSNPWIAGGAILAILVLSIPLLWRLIGFAKANPQAAILEGAEFLLHTQLTLASKGHGPYTDEAALEVLEPDTSPTLPSLPLGDDDPDAPDAVDAQERG